MSPRGKKAQKPTRAEELLADCRDLRDPKELRRAARRVLGQVERGTAEGVSQRDVTLLHLMIAESFWAQGQTRRTQREYFQLLEHDSKHALAHIRLGLIAEIEGERDLAEGHYDKAVQHAHKESKADARIALARFLRRHGEYKEALHHLKLVARSERGRGPASAEAAYVRGLLAGYDPEAAKGWRATFQRLAGDDPFFSYCLANLDLWDGRHLEGVRRLRAFIARIETAPPPLGATLYFELKHARKRLMQIDSAQSMPMP